MRRSLISRTHASFISNPTWKGLRQSADGLGFPPATAKFPPTIMLATDLQLKINLINKSKTGQNPSIYTNAILTISQYLVRAVVFDL